MKRLFVAIHLQATDTMLALLNQLKSKLHADQINWVRTENMHLTLKFLGEISEQEIPSITEQLFKAAKKNHSFQLQFDRTGIFGSRYDPRVIWLGMNYAPDKLIQLANKVLDSMDQIGFLRDRQNFVPHLTLGRIKRLTDKNHFQSVIQTIPQQTYLEADVKQFILFESILRKEGPVYREIQRFDLQKDV